MKAAKAPWHEGFKDPMPSLASSSFTGLGLQDFFEAELKFVSLLTKVFALQKTFMVRRPVTDNALAGLASRSFSIRPTLSTADQRQVKSPTVSTRCSHTKTLKPAAHSKTVTGRESFGWLLSWCKSWLERTRVPLNQPSPKRGTEGVDQSGMLREVGGMLYSKPMPDNYLANEKKITCGTGTFYG